MKNIPLAPIFHKIVEQWPIRINIQALKMNWTVDPDIQGRSKGLNFAIYLMLLVLVS